MYKLAFARDSVHKTTNLFNKPKSRFEHFYQKILHLVKKNEFKQKYYFTSCYLQLQKFCRYKPACVYSVGKFFLIYDTHRKWRRVNKPTLKILNY